MPKNEPRSSLARFRAMGLLAAVEDMARYGSETGILHDAPPDIAEAYHAARHACTALAAAAITTAQYYEAIAEGLIPPEEIPGPPEWSPPWF